MPRSTLSAAGMPENLKKQLKTLGEHIRLARKRRGMTMQDMAERMFITRKTLKRLESGDPGCSLGILASALLVLGLEDDLDLIANPDKDDVGNAIDRVKYEKSKRTRSPGSKKLDLNF